MSRKVGISMLVWRAGWCVRQLLPRTWWGWLLAACILRPSLLRDRNQAKCLREHLAFCCEEGRIRKSNAPLDWEPREGGWAACSTRQRLSHTWGACPSQDYCREPGGQALGGPGSPTILSCGTPQPEPSQAEPGEGRWGRKVPA